MLNNICFKDYKKNNDIHGTVLYPAVMIAPVQKQILNEILEEDKICSIFDPFCGSGTALYEGMKTSQHIHLIGCDINPLAILITRVKLQGVQSGIYDDIDYIKDFLDKPRGIYTYKFPNINKWFREDIIESIGLLRSSIIGVDDDQNRLFLWYMLCDILRRYSNTRSSTYKLHIKESRSIASIENKVLESYISSISKNADKFKNSSDNFILYKRDSLELMQEFDSRSVDVSITSPPYGDNATTVPYGQFSMLALYTIPAYDLELEGWELDNYSTIDSHSMGGGYIRNEIELNEFEKSLLSPYLKKISMEKQGKVIRFFRDYFFFLRELCRITNKYIVLTLGNRTVDRVRINLTKITRVYLEENNFTNVKCAKRDIPVKRTPKITSVVYQHPVDSMNCEYVLIHKRRL